MIEIQFGTNLNKQVFPTNITPQEIIQQKNFKLKNIPIAAYFNKKLIELNRHLTKNGILKIITIDHPKSIEILNHSIMHLMTQAIIQMYPSALLVIGKTLREGFYYDIDFQDKVFSVNDLPKIEQQMHQMAEINLETFCVETDAKNAYQLFNNNPYKKIILKNIHSSIINIYKRGDFCDLCSEIHLINTKIMKYFKLLKISGSYFQGNANQKVLTRIYGIAFFNQIDLDSYLNLLQERKISDHKYINKEQNFFMLSSQIGSGLPFWLPKGATIRRIIERYIVDKEIAHNYQHVYTPILANKKLYENSGHLELYKDNMFPIMKLSAEEELVLRPMNCPHHMMIFQNKIHSYKELPIKIAELGMMHRYEHSGTVSGLQRVREMTLNDAHIFIAEQQIKEEFTKIINLIKEVYEDFNIKDYSFNLSTRDPNNKEKYFNDNDMWQRSETILRKILDNLNIKYQEKIGDAAFYGPKLDVQILTALGHEETLSTVQLDFLLPKKFNLTYIDQNNQRKNPVIIHRAIISTIERFIAHLIEKNKGIFPLWLAPIQVILIPINNNLHLEHTKKIRDLLLKANLRTEINDKEHTLNYKIRETQKAKIPFQIVIGEKEIQTEILICRQYGNNQKQKLSVHQLIQMLNEIIQNKK
ncbi:threonine--tRNA ligase [Candidatus Phytoplasma melaleucae]|uniref:Threonine--tRNA ligase n=1 Tax=Candidatus Phytoplasma melaleucae TaxID=2982630 RepID=A0ABT9DDA0_9MOLU|nr:threonine--tRNA ligase ['Melaleuca sp.' phytoplasma]MDO8168063.1 threonine--tRNA ligase ['Melaleuca sp.' phytoplasma]